MTTARSAFVVGSAPRFRAWLPFVCAVVLASAAFAWLDHLNPSVLLTEDAIRDQLLARDCAELGRCHLVGEAASLRGFYQGTLWPDLLIAVRLLGGDTTTDRTAVLALMAVSVATVFMVVWHWLRPSVALPAAMVLLGVLSHDSSASTLIDQGGALLPDVLAAAGLLCFGLSGLHRFLVVAAFAVATAINVHIAAFSLLAPLVIMAPLTGRRPWRQIGLALVVLLVTCVLTSSGALRANVIAVAGQGRLMPGLAGGVIVAAVCARLAPRFGRLSWDVRAFLIGVALVLPFILASLWLSFAQEHDVSFLYLHPVMAPAAVFAAGLLCVPFELGARRVSALRWLPTVAAFALIGGIGVLGWPRAATSSPAWNLAEAHVIAEGALRRGWSYEDLVFHLQGNACRELLVLMSVHAPPPAPAPGDRRRQLQVVKLARAALPTLEDADDVIALGPTAVAVVRDIESWLAPESLTACRVPIDSRAARACVPALTRPMEARAPERFLFSPRSFPEVHFLDLRQPYVARYEIPLRPGAGESRDLVLTDSAVGDCGWRIVSVEGVGIEGALPARRVRLRAGDGTPGVVVIEKPFGTPDCRSERVQDMRYPPCVFETRPGDPLAVLAEAS